VNTDSSLWLTDEEVGHVQVRVPVSYSVLSLRLEEFVPAGNRINQYICSKSTFA